MTARYGASEKSIQIWAQKYREHGGEAFIWKAGNAQYSKGFKMMSVETVLQGEDNLVMDAWNSDYPMIAILVDIVRVSVLEPPK